MLIKSFLKKYRENRRAEIDAIHYQFPPQLYLSYKKKNKPHNTF